MRQLIRKYVQSRYINKMINIQKYGSKRGKSRKQIYNPVYFRITQLASTSVDKFIKLQAQSGQNHVKRHFSCEKKEFQLPLSKTIHLFFNQNTVANYKKSQEVQKIAESPIEKIYKNKKKNYSNYIKQSRLKIKSTTNNEFINIQNKPRPLSHINFNQVLFYKDANLITRKRKSTQKNNATSYHSKTEVSEFSQVVVVRSKQLSKIEKEAFRSFLELSNNHKSDQQNARNQVDFVLQENKTTAVVPISICQESKVNVKSQEKKVFMARTHSEQSQMKLYQHFVPFKKVKEKRKPFTFALFEKQNKIKQLNNSRLLVYKDFLWKINYSNGLYVSPNEEKQPTFKVFIGWGNNDNLIKNIMKRRFWWTSSQNTQEANFIWSQLKVSKVFARQNNFTEKCIKSSKIEDNDQELPKLRLKSKGHYKIFNSCDMANWIVHQQKNKSSEVFISEKTYKNRSELIKSKEMIRVESSEKLVVHNHFIANGYIGNKKALFYNLKKYCELNKKDVFEIIPFTVHLSKGIEDQEWTYFKNVYQKYEIQKQKCNLQNVWIMKPGENSNRGIGITVYHDIQDIRLRLKSKEKNKDGSLRTFIIQKYIQKPLLYYERKFDIRHYLLMSCINGRFKAYWYQQGYIRTSSSPYSLKRGSNLFAHLTNDAIQKNSEDYGKFEPGNKISYKKLDNYLFEVTKGKQNYFTEWILPRMKEMATEAVKSTYLNLDADRKLHNFELFGMDFMIDSQLKPWLIEINTNPCLQMNCPLLAKIIPKLLQQTLQICLDPIFPPPNEWPNNKTLWISENPLENTSFQLIFDQETQGEEIVALMGSSMHKIKVKIGQVEEQQNSQESET